MDLLVIIYCIEYDKKKNMKVIQYLKFWPKKRVNVARNERILAETDLQKQNHNKSLNTVTF